MIHFASSDILPLYSFTVALIKLSTVSLQNFFFVTRSVTPQKPPRPDDAPSASPATATRSVAHTWYPSPIHTLLNACQGMRDKSFQYKTFLRHERRSCVFYPLSFTQLLQRIISRFYLLDPKE